MDDSQDKVRRNLVAVATAIILIQILQIQIEPNAKVGIFSVDKVSQLQFWLLALTILVYVFQRYWFDGVTRVQREDAWMEFYQIRDTKITAKLTADVRGHVVKGRALRLVSGISKWVNEYRAAHYPSDSYDYVHIGLFRFSGSFWPVAGNTQIEMTRTKNGSVVSSVRTDQTPTYRIPMREVLEVTAMPVLRTALISKTAVDFQGYRTKTYE